MRFLEKFVQEIVRSIDSIAITVIAIVCILVGIRGFIDSAVQESDQTSNIILTLLGALSISFLIAKYKFEVQLKNIKTLSMNNVSSKIDVVSAEFSPDYKELIDNQIKHLKESVDDFIQSGTITITDSEYFPLLYEEALRRYPGRKLLAAGLARDDYLWGNPRIMESMEKYISDGGSITRYFILRDSDFNESEVISVMKSQAEIEVDVRYVYKSELAKRFDNFGLISESFEFGWMVEINKENKIVEINVTNDKNKLRSDQISLSKLFHKAYEFHKNDAVLASPRSGRP